MQTKLHAIYVNYQGDMILHDWKGKKHVWDDFVEFCWGTVDPFSILMQQNWLKAHFGTSKSAINTLQPCSYFYKPILSNRVVSAFCVV